MKKIFAFLYFSVLGYIIFTSSDLTIFLNELSYVKCGTAEGIPKLVPQLISVLYTILMFGIPIVLIAFGILTLVKAVGSGNPDETTKARGKLAKKFMMAAIAFCVALVVRTVINVVVNTNDNTDSTSVAACLNCFLSYSDNNCAASTSGNDVHKNESREPYTSEKIKTSNVKPGSNSSANRPGANTSVSAEGKLKVKQALTVLHTGQSANSKDNSVSMYEAAGNAKFYAVECDIRVNSSGTGTCKHESGNTGTSLTKYAELLKQYNMVGVLDFKSVNDTGLIKYIKDNNLKDRVILQHNSISSMNNINKELPGIKHWYLMGDSSAYNSFMGNVDKYKAAGVVGVNIEYTAATKAKVDALHNKGLEVCVYFYWDSEARRNSGADYGPEYIMINNTNI